VIVSTGTAADGAPCFMVTVTPPHPGHPPKLFEDHRAARGWGGGLKMVRGWKLVDQVMEARHAG
jgi:hypothetical protein